MNIPKNVTFMHAILSFLRKWSLPAGMLSGAMLYFLLHLMSLPSADRQLLLDILAFLQPMFIFLMLLLSFLKIPLSEISFRRWQLWGVLLQVSLWSLGVMALQSCRQTLDLEQYYGIEAFLICMICPTATASSVVTRKLGGNTGTITLYILLINTFSALFVSAMVPLLYEGSDFLSSFFLIVCKIFPLLIAPFVVAQFIIRFMPRLQQRLLLIPDLAFYLWIVSLALAIGVTVRNIVNSHCTVILLSYIALGSCVAAILQFFLGRKFGRRDHDVIAASQALGQKNTVFAIWMGATFMSPVSAVAGGFYSIWHNVWNSYQLNHHLSGKN